MIITPIKTQKMVPPQDDLWQLLDQSLLNLADNTILAIASKVVSIGEGRCISADQVPDKDKLIISESSLYLPREHVPGKWLMHTISHNLLIGTAGIDESNGNGYYILWPEDPTASAKKIWSYLTNKFKIKNLGVILTDSHTIPLRRGLVGISLAHFGFEPLNDYRGRNDLFGREMKVSQSNIPDSLASVAVLAMGEGSEQTPVVLITDFNQIKFTDKPAKSSEPFSNLNVPIEEDLYRPFLKAVLWKKGAKI